MAGTVFGVPSGNDVVRFKDIVSPVSPVSLVFPVFPRFPVFHDYVSLIIGVGYALKTFVKNSIVRFQASSAAALS